MRSEFKVFLVLFLFAAGVFSWMAFTPNGLTVLKSLRDTLRPGGLRFWQTEIQIELPEPDAPHALTPAELETKAVLETMLASREPAYRLTRKDSRPLDGDVVEEYPDYIVFCQKYGDSAEIKMRVAREQIASLEKLPRTEAPEITDRDVRFHLEFPDLFFFKANPYTVVSQESYFAIQRMVQEQQRLYAEFTGWFGSLINTATNSSDIQLLVFSDKERFDSYLAVRAPQFKGYSGLYTQRENRLITYHQRDSEWVEEGTKKIDEVAAQYREIKLSSRGEAQLRQWQLTEKDKLRGAAQQATDRTLRHEGSHQLFFCLGVQDSRQRGRLWVTEGLATFCETDKIGRINQERLLTLKEAVDQNRLISLRELLTITEMPDAQKYAEAWSFTHMLMQPDYQSQFFDYLRWLRDHSTQPSTDPAGELTSFLKVDFVQLENQWKAYVAGITRF